MGINIPTREELIANKLNTTREFAERVGTKVKLVLIQSEKSQKINK